MKPDIVSLINLALGFGLAYCEKFASSAPNWTPNGKVWLFAVRECLQKKLLPSIKNVHTELTCPKLKEFAFETHGDCYVNTAVGVSVCDLPIQDWVQLVNVVGLKQALLDLDSIKLALAINKGCLQKFLHIGGKFLEQ